MNETISNIIADIPAKAAFDSHFIIERLIKDYSDVYLTFVATSGSGARYTNNIHSQIAQEIASFEKGPIERLKNESWSYNIHGKPSQCVLWVKH